ncbi:MULTISPECIES: type II secretion system F family protein [Snodgrassella]|uniref:type II secretion system F family protein n=1 Tax=Snodgrassella TaxID=1193515 RepID=UPI0004D6F149|nr:MULTISPECIES: type II secretion system F family protein [Snodgrassella]KES09773.1 Type II secretory pathway, component PulF [Snodgrassella alvi SCGC AB-598-O11]MBI0068500.1 type II secretion system F family protein [Snodgrassella sp. M0110]MBI0077498.1 type II secretion system F family protein [Snodgrassella sp. M0118]MBI0079937.1 type II secretion system F family protein [Snodgrassella sp. M0112]NUF77661.1 type II secretion system F family protein [Snodgrassella sp. ESL0323]
MNKPVAVSKTKPSGTSFSFEGKNLKTEQIVRGEVTAKNEAEARSKLKRRQIRVIQITKVKKQRQKKISQADITVFTRQLSTMMKSGLPLMQAFDIAAKGHSNRSMTQLLMEIRSDVEQGTSLADSFAKHPKYFDDFYCNLISAGEAGGVLEALLDKLAVYKEKTQSIKKKVKSALTYPVVVVIVAVVLVIVMMMFVLPSFAKVYQGMGVALPWLTQVMMNISDFFVRYGIFIVMAIVLGAIGFYKWFQSSADLRKRFDHMLLKLPIFGPIVRKATIARWARTTATLFAAGVPLVEVLDSVAGAAGNIEYEEATQEIRAKVNQGISLTSAMQATELFPNMVMQMASIGEESGSLDDMLNKAAELYEDDVDIAVSQLSSLMEPIIMVVLGLIIGVILVAMYLPMFNMGNAIG